MTHFDLIALDADDTLWHNERLYLKAQTRFIELLSKYHPAEWVSERLYRTETRNLQHFGYGIKAFALSMIETMVELTEERLTGQDVQVLIDMAKEMLSARVELLAQVAETVPLLAAQRRLVVLTKGDLLDQESKLARSGLADFLPHIEVVSDKNSESYRRVLRRWGVEPACFLMVGNSLRSDILPVLAIGGSAVYIPYETTWQHEIADLPPADTRGFSALEHFGQLPALLDRLEKESAATL